jgi:hypothetical protein
MTTLGYFFQLSDTQKSVKNEGIATIDSAHAV